LHKKEKKPKPFICFYPNVGHFGLPAEVFSLSAIEEFFPTSLRAGTMTEASFSRNWHGGASVRGNT
jgi:hypothetical protein